MYFYLKDLLESLDYLIHKGRKVNPGAFTFIVKYLALAVLSMLASVLSFITDWDLTIRIILYVLSLVIFVVIVRKLLWKLRHPDEKRLH